MSTLILKDKAATDSPTDAEIQAEYSELMDLLANTPKSLIPDEHLAEYDRLRSEAETRGLTLTPDVDLHT